MKIKDDWKKNLQNFKIKETNRIFCNCSEKVFKNALELGAGDGFQSKLLLRYADKFICTDYDKSILENKNSDSVEYRICDAEKFNHNYKEKQFDLIFSSNLLEHLVDLNASLKEMFRILKDDGIAIHVMPSVFWKMCHIFFHPINKVLLFIEKFLQKITNNNKKTGETVDNNPKTTRDLKPFVLRQLIPEPHGTSSSNIKELIAFRRRRWVKEFNKAGFDIITVKKGPVSSGYGFGFNFLKDFLESLKFSSENIFIIKKKGIYSPYQKFFEFNNHGKNR